MARTPRPVTLVLAGTGTTTPENINDLLNDLLSVWLNDPAKDPGPTDITVHIVTTLDSYGQTTEHFVDWISSDIGLPFTVITDDREPSEDLEYLYQDAEKVTKVKPGSLVDTVISLVTSESDKDRDVHLVLSWGPGDEAPDLLTDELLIAAHEHEIVPRDVSQGLEDLITQPPDEAAPEPEARPERERRSGRGRRRATPLAAEEKPLIEPEPEPEPEPNSRSRQRRKAILAEREVDSAAQDPAVEPAPEPLTSDKARELLARAYEYLLKVDGFLDRKLPLTEEIGGFLKDVPTQEPPEVISVWVDENAGTVRKARRGRRKGTERPANMTLAEIEAKYGPQDWS